MADALARARWLLLASWAGYLALPSRHVLAGGLLFAVGAALYAFLGSVSVMYTFGHSGQVPLLFVAGAACCAHDLGSNPRAGAWLRNYLLLGLLVPSYLAAGMAKLRYVGLEPLLSGEWLFSQATERMLADGSIFVRGTMPLSSTVLLQMPHTAALMSWGMLVLEVALPLCLLLQHAPDLSTPSRAANYCRVLFLLTAAAFHAVTFFLFGPNFLRQTVLVILALDPARARSLVSPRIDRGIDDSSHLLGDCSGFTGALRSAPSRPEIAEAEEAEEQGRRRRTQEVAGGQATASPIRLSDRLRSTVASVVLVSWMLEQLRHDALRLFTDFPRNKDPDLFWPISSMSMYANPLRTASFGWTAVLGVLVLARFGCDAVFGWGEDCFSERGC